MNKRMKHKRIKKGTHHDARGENIVTSKNTATCLYSNYGFFWEAIVLGIYSFFVTIVSIVE